MSSQWMGSTTQRRMNTSLKTPPVTLECTFTHGHVASGKVGNYAELCRAPKILSQIRGSPLTCPSPQTPRRCHDRIILPSASVSVVGWAALGSIACPAVTPYQVSASPSSRSLSLSTPSLYFTAGVVTPSKRRPVHYSLTQRQKYGYIKARLDPHYFGTAACPEAHNNH